MTLSGDYYRVVEWYSYLALLSSNSLVASLPQVVVSLEEPDFSPINQGLSIVLSILLLQD